jgi:hypothetical protein
VLLKTKKSKGENDRLSRIKTKSSKEDKKSTGQAFLVKVLKGS